MIQTIALSERHVKLLQTCIYPGVQEDELGLVLSALHSYAAGERGLTIPFGSVVGLSKPLEDVLRKSFPSRTTIACDLPVFLKSVVPNAPTVMVCALDSLPPEPLSGNPVVDAWIERKIDFSENIVFWAPFGVIDDWSAPKGSMASNVSFFRELLQHFNVYITDIYKLFFRISINGRFIKSNTLPAYTSLALHGELLQAEIDLVQPVGILTLGNPSRDAFLAVTKEGSVGEVWGNDIQRYSWIDGRPIVALPHISNAANGAKKHILANKKYEHLDSVYQNGKLAKIAVQNLANFATA